MQYGVSVVNIGGNGEVARAINLNPQTDQQNLSAPHLIEARGEQIAQLFPANSIDRVVSNNIVHGPIDWNATARGAFTVLRSGGEVSIAPYVSGDTAQHVSEMSRSFETVVFINVHTDHDIIIKAIKP